MPTPTPVPVPAQIPNAGIWKRALADILEIQVCKNSTGDGVSLVAAPVLRTSVECGFEPGCPTDFGIERWDDADYWNSSFPTRIYPPRNGRYAIGINCAIGCQSPVSCGPFLIRVFPCNIAFPCPNGPTFAPICLGTLQRLDDFDTELYSYPLVGYCEVELSVDQYLYVAIQSLDIAQGDWRIGTGEIGEECVVTVRHISTPP